MIYQGASMREKLDMPVMKNIGHHVYEHTKLICLAPFVIVKKAGRRPGYSRDKTFIRPEADSGSGL